MKESQQIEITCKLIFSSDDPTGDTIEAGNHYRMHRNIIPVLYNNQVQKMKNAASCWLTTLLVMLSLMLYAGRISGQITIGAGIEPVHGALLDLKEEQRNDGTENSKKGMMLPRVKLSDQNKLFPMFTNGYDGAENSRHIGLTVYNIYEDACNGIPKGVYVWDGTQWQPLSGGNGGNGVVGADVEYMTDTRDSEQYLTGNFGAAGQWFLENLRYLPPSASGIVLSTNADTNTTKSYYYPNGTPADNGNPPSTWQRQQGLLYSFPAATSGYWIGNNEDRSQSNGGSVPGDKEVESVPALESAPGAKDGKLQGICPDGWHVPSDREWNQLEKEIYDHAEKYSQYTKAQREAFNITTPWNSAWEYNSYDFRPPGSPSDAHGKAMKSQCAVLGGMSPVGLSFPAKQGGFSVLLTGYINLKGGSNNDYGEEANFFTCSPRYGSGFRYRNLDYQAADVYNNAHGGGELFSVRCKKDY